MKTIEIGKASASGHAGIVDDVIIRIANEVVLPNGESVSNVDYFSSCAEVYQTDAKALAAGLQAALPGGTFDRLVVELLQLKASHYRVPWLEFAA